MRYKNRHVTSHMICVTIQLREWILISEVLMSEGEVRMENWWIYLIVGLVVGMNLGYMVGIRRGLIAISELLDGIMKAVGENGKG